MTACEGGTDSALYRRAFNRPRPQIANDNNLTSAAWCAVCSVFGCSKKYLAGTVDELIKVDLECNQAEHFAEP